MTVFSRSNGDVGRRIDEQLEEVNRHLQRSAAIGMERLTRGELVEVFLECMNADWDGFNALPVTFETYLLAERFLLCLPLATQHPSIGAEPSGNLTLEWYGGVRRNLTVSIDEGGFVHYAALIGPERAYGTKEFIDSVPSVILELIQRVSS